MLVGLEDQLHQPPRGAIVGSIKNGGKEELTPPGTTATHIRQPWVDIDYPGLS